MMTAMAASDDAAIARTAARFDAPAPVLEPIARDLTRQMARGLVGEPSSLKMLQTFTRQPSGRERGRVVVVDWGGTKARAGLVELGPGGAVRIVAEEALTFSEADKRGAPEPVFDLIARAVGRVAQGQGVAAAPLAFIYSYPARLERIDRAVALASTKGWRLKGLVGQDVAALLGAALLRAGLARIALAAVANDTVAALMLHSYRARGRDAAARPADVGLIVGTGTNLAADLGPAVSKRPTTSRSTARSTSRRRARSASRRWSPAITWARSCAARWRTWGSGAGRSPPHSPSTARTSRASPRMAPRGSTTWTRCSARSAPRARWRSGTASAPSARRSPAARLGWSGRRSSARCASSMRSSPSGVPSRWTAASGAATRGSKRSCARPSASCLAASGRAGSRPRT